MKENAVNTERTESFFDAQLEFDRSEVLGWFDLDVFKEFGKTRNQIVVDQETEAFVVHPSKKGDPEEEDIKDERE